MDGPVKSLSFESWILGCTYIDTWMIPKEDGDICS